MIQPSDYIAAARRHNLKPQSFGLWQIMRHDLTGVERFLGGISTMTSLRHLTEATMHLEPAGEVVMEDSPRELRKHLPIWMAAHGRVLKTGLGMGCVVRGLLLKPEVTHIDVVEIDADIIRVIGAEFLGHSRVTIHHADALTFEPGGLRWDFAWHDIWCPGNQGLDVLHARLMRRFHAHAGQQGAWAFPRWACRVARSDILGSKRIRRAA